MRDESCVWYAAYGSNLLEERLLCYFRGTAFRLRADGQPQQGCSDPTPPTHRLGIRWNLPIRFSLKTTPWGPGGVAFLDDRHPTSDPCFARLYRMRWPQFCEVFAQENAYGREDYPEIRAALTERAEAGALDHFVYPGQSGYARLRHFGAIDAWAPAPENTMRGEPVLSFTHETTEALSRTQPNEAYLLTLALGLQEAFPQTPERQCHAYLARTSGMPTEAIETLLTRMGKRR